MASTVPYEISCDPTANLMRIRLSGTIDAKNMQACVDEIEKGLHGLRPRFKVLTDLSAIQNMDTACIPKVKHMMDLCRTKGVETVVRVIPSGTKDIGFNILSFFHYPKKVQILTFSTTAEAEKALAGGESAAK